MYYRNKKEYHIGTAYTNKITTNSTFTFVLIAVIVSSVAVVTIASISMHKVGAQMSNSNNMGGNMKGSGGKSSMSMSMGSNMGSKAPQLNITTVAPPISPTMFKSMASQMHVDLINATMIAQKWVGSNSHAVSSMIALQNGTPVYTIWIIDSNSGLHQILVDPQSGKVVFANQPMSMTGPFS